MASATTNPSKTTTLYARPTRYCVSVMMADYYSVWLEAEDEDHALELASSRWSDEANEDFTFDRSERPSIDVVDWEYV